MPRLFLEKKKIVFDFSKFFLCFAKSFLRFANRCFWLWDLKVHTRETIRCIEQR